MRSCTAICDREGCLDDRGEEGWPRSSWKLWRCCADALGIEEMRSEGVLPIVAGESMLEWEDVTAEGGELIGGSRLGVDMFAADSRPVSVVRGFAVQAGIVVHNAGDFRSPLVVGRGVGVCYKQIDKRTRNCDLDSNASCVRILNFRRVNPGVLSFDGESF